ncbi:hypothetical protein [Streptomyces syringium]|uniref:hypothetical protein n=1 Tax=Streptomyces syringium TaxID=76729 RepID=UPI0033E21D87
MGHSTTVSCSPSRAGTFATDAQQGVYFKDGGSRAQNLEVAFTGIDYFDVSF